MAPKDLKDAPADGAKPGAEADKGEGAAHRHAFDADGRAAAREGAPVTIGGATFHRRRKNWEVTRETRRLLRAQDRASGRARRLAAQVDALTDKIRGVRDRETGHFTIPPMTDEQEIEALEGTVDDLENREDAATEQADDAAYELIALLLRNDAGDHPTVDHLKEHLDVEEAGDLASMLAGGGEPDPTPTTESSSAT